MKPTKSKSKKFWSAVESFFSVPAVQLIVLLILFVLVGGGVQ